VQSKNSHKHAIGKRFPIQEICNSKKYLTGNKIFSFQTSHYLPQPYRHRSPLFIWTKWVTRRTWKNKWSWKKF